MAQDVLCEVNNCKFWANGNKCSADAIYVVSHKGNKHLQRKKQIAKLSIQNCKFLKGSQIVVALLLILVLIINLIFIHYF